MGKVANLNRDGIERAIVSADMAQRRVLLDLHGYGRSPLLREWNDAILANADDRESLMYENGLARGGFSGGRRDGAATGGHDVVSRERRDLRRSQGRDRDESPHPRAQLHRARRAWARFTKLAAGTTKAGMELGRNAPFAFEDAGLELAAALQVPVFFHEPTALSGVTVDALVANDRGVGPLQAPIFALETGEDAPFGDIEESGVGERSGFGMAEHRAGKSVTIGNTHL